METRRYISHQIVVIVLQLFVAVLLIGLSIVQTLQNGNNGRLATSENFNIYAPDLGIGYWFGTFLIISAVFSMFQVKFDNRPLTIVCVILQIVTAIVSFIAIAMYTAHVYVVSLPLKGLLNENKLNTYGAISFWKFLQAEGIVGLLFSFYGFFSNVFQACFLLKANFSCCSCCQCCSSEESLSFSPDSITANSNLQQQQQNSFFLLNRGTKFIVIGVLELLLSAAFMILEIGLLFPAFYNVSMGIGVSSALTLTTIGGLSIFYGMTGHRGLAIGTVVMAILTACKFASLSLLNIIIISVSSSSNIPSGSIVACWGMTALLLNSIFLLIIHTIFCWARLCTNGCCGCYGDAPTSMGVVHYVAENQQQQLSFTLEQRQATV